MSMRSNEIKHKYTPEPVCPIWHDPKIFTSYNVTFGKCQPNETNMHASMKVYSDTKTDTETIDITQSSRFHVGRQGSNTTITTQTH